MKTTTHKQKTKQSLKTHCIEYRPYDILQDTAYEAGKAESR